MNKSAAKEADVPEEAARLADDEQTAEYIGDLVIQLERLARMQGLVTLQYQLSVCREEAERIAAGDRRA